MSQRNPHATVAERARTGQLARARITRRSLGSWKPAPDRADPVALLASQEAGRVQELLPLRHARMAVSPFAFYRGGALIMAADLASRANTGLTVQLCGDAHLSNFGLFAGADRRLVFDVNDFDETNPGPFEWDVLRLAASVELVGRGNGLARSAIRNAVSAVALGYRRAMADYASKGDLDTWYSTIDIKELVSWARADRNASAERAVRRTANLAERRDRWSAIDKLTESVDGRIRFKEQPPLLVHLDAPVEAQQALDGLVDQYGQTLSWDRRRLLNRYRMIDVGHKVVGVGSVGLLAFVILLQGRDESDLLVLQVKQAVPSVLEAFTSPSEFPHPGERVVAGQRITQASPDVFLGWVTGPGSRSFYVRQLRDMKFAPDPAKLNAKSLGGYAALCGVALARAHARSGDAVAISAYLGASSRFDAAVVEFTSVYADQVTDDFRRYSRAIASGQVSVAKDVNSVDLDDVKANVNALREPAE